MNQTKLLIPDDRYAVWQSRRFARAHLPRAALVSPVELSVARRAFALCSGKKSLRSSLLEATKFRGLGAAPIKGRV
jgi:hypothetical protein